MRLPARFGFRRIVLAVALLLTLVIAWAGFERAKCRNAFNGSQSVQRNHTRDDVKKVLGTPDQVLTGSDVLSKLYWGSDVALARNDGQVVRDERYVYDGLWGSYLIVIGYAPDGSVKSKYFYDG
jgi:hypothetical protein